VVNCLARATSEQSCIWWATTPAMRDTPTCRRRFCLCVEGEGAHYCSVYNNVQQCTRPVHGKDQWEPRTHRHLRHLMSKVPATSATDGSGASATSSAFAPVNRKNWHARELLTSPNRPNMRICAESDWLGSVCVGGASTSVRSTLANQPKSVTAPASLTRQGISSTK